VNFGDDIHVKSLSEMYVCVAIKQTLWTRHSCFFSETRFSPENGSRWSPKGRFFFLSIRDDWKILVNVCDSTHVKLLSKFICYS